MSGYAVSDSAGSIDRWGNCSDGMEMMQATQPGEIAVLCSLEIQATLNAAAQRGQSYPYKVNTANNQLEPVS